VAIRDELIAPGDAYFNFRNTGSVRALALLLVRAARFGLHDAAAITSESPVVSCREYLPTAELCGDLVSGNSWISAFFGSGEDSADGKVICWGRSGTVHIVFLTSGFLDSAEIGIFFNGEAVGQTQSLESLEQDIVNGGFDTTEVEDARTILLLRRLPVITDEVQYMSSGEVNPKLLNIFSDKLEEKLIRCGVNAVRERLDELTNRELAYHLSQDTRIEILPRDIWQISFEFEVINAGFLPLSRRTHQFWFEYPQKEIQFKIEDSAGRPLDYQVVKSTEKYREILLGLPRALEALERFKYKITYQVKGIVERDSFYYLSPRTLTKKLGLTVSRLDGRRFENPKVTVESDGGFMKDTVPDLEIQSEETIETISWSQQSPKPGELYRTLWTNSELVQVPIIKKGKLLLLSSRREENISSKR